MKHRVQRLIGICGVIAAAGSANAQVISAGEVIELVAPDAAQFAANDAERKAQGLAPRFALPQDVNFTPDNSGQWRRAANGDYIWTLRVVSRGAENLNFGFLQYNLPPGASLHIASTDGRQEIRPFTANDNKDHGQLWTPVLGTDDATIELIVGHAERDKVELMLGSINVGYRPFGERPAADIASRDGACNVDVVCPEGDDWRDEISSVGVISTGGSTFCTGFMVNNVEQDRTPFFMTAFHCGVRSGDAPSLVVYWNFQNSTCRPPGSGASGGPGDGVLDEFNTGSTLLAEGAASDFTLVELDQSPPESSEVAFSGWDNRFYEPLGVVGIHHPSTDEKRISFEFDQTTSVIGLTSSPEVPVNDSTHVKVPDWDVGTTEGGSSGSPLYDLNTKRVIGQLHGGTASCSSQTYDAYGRIARSWDNGTAGNSLQPWLDPNNTGAEFVDTLPARGLIVTPGSDVLSYGVIGGPFTDDTTVYTIENTSGVSLDYRVAIQSGGNAPVLINGGTSAITGTLADGTTAPITVTFSKDASTLGAGLYDSTIVFEDLTSGASVARTHELEVGLTSVEVGPASDFLAGGPVGGPFNATQTYTLTSERPTPPSFEVAADQPWITLNGQSGPLTINLTGEGDTANVEVGFSATAAGLPAGLVEGEVTFTNLTDGNGTTSRGVTLDVGRFRYAPDDVPQSITSNNSFTSSVFVPDDFCVADVDVSLDITHTFIGDLRVVLTNPVGVSVTLHDRTGGSSDDIVVTYDSSAQDADGPGSLDDFAGASSAGEWTLTVSDLAGGDEGTLNGWELAIASASGDCPTPVEIVAFPLDSDPGWARTGDWAFGVPAGIDGDPSAGATGANVFGYNLNGEYPNNMGIEYLTAGPFDFSDATNVRLIFERWLGVESSSFDDAQIQVSADGSNWDLVWANPGSTIQDSSWLTQSFNISSVADGQNSVFVRWQMGSTDSSVTYAGWNIDDVRFTGVVPTPVCDGDANGDGQVTALDISLVLGNFGSTGPDGDVNGDGQVTALDISLVLGNFGASCPTP